MKCLVLLLSVVTLLKAEEDPTGGVSPEKKLKTAKSNPGESWRSWRLNDRPKIFYTITDRIPTGDCKVKVEENDLVRFEAYGYNLNGRRFDSGEYESQIGHNDMIKGIDEGIRGLCYGEERSLRIDPEWGYGEGGLTNRVSPNTTIIFDIKVLNIERVKTDERKGLKMEEYLKFSDTNKVEDCGMKVKGGDKINWKYEGKLMDGTVFDKGDFTAVIDKREVIHGVNEAMKGLCVGGKRTMLMHHGYAYGARGTGNIPGYANLIFDVYLYSIDRPGFGMESIDSKLRKAGMTEENAIKKIDRIPTGDCAAVASKGDTVTYFYHAYLLNGKIFDQGQSEGIIQDLVPPGLNEGLIGLCVGDERSITLHPSVGHGVEGLTGKVPVNATVIYDVRILNIARTISSEDPTSSHGVDVNTGLKPNQKLKIEIMHGVENCKIKSREGDTLHWNYRGSFLDGTEFHKGTFKATLGKGQVIVGVDRGMRDMCIGEKRQLTVHSDWAYGNEGRPGSIPPRATLVFDNELTNIERPEDEETKAEL